MNSAYISAIAALAGSGIGAVASFATTWLTQDAQERTRRVAHRVTRREHLYGEFIEEASRLFTDALTHELDDPSKFVRLSRWSGDCGSSPPPMSSQAQSRSCSTSSKPTTFPIGTSAIRRRSRRRISICFGRSAKLAVKIWVFRSSFAEAAFVAIDGDCAAERQLMLLQFEDARCCSAAPGQR